MLKSPAFSPLRLFCPSVLLTKPCVKIGCKMASHRRSMQIKQTIRIALLLILAVATGYWLGFRDGKKSSGVTLAAAQSKQIGLSFRQDRNDLATPLPAPSRLLPIA